MAIKVVTDPAEAVLLDPVTGTLILPAAETETEPTEGVKTAKPEIATVTDAGTITVTLPT